jgi:hypothetical protein
MSDTGQLTYDEKRAIVLKQFDEFINDSKRLQNPESLKFIQKAFELADKAHEGQFRKNRIKTSLYRAPHCCSKNYYD